MEDEYINPKYKRKKTNITNRHYYEVENFNTVLDMQLQELDNRFSEVTTELLICIGSLSPDDIFSAFNVQKTLRLAEFYPFDFSYEEKKSLMIELGNYIIIIIMRNDGMFANVNVISNLAKRMVETKKHLRYTLVYRLLKLALILLILLVAMASVERCFSSMKHVKTDLCNRMGNDYMNDCRICYIERDLLANVSVDDVIDRFQKMKTRREQL
ncbi:putative HAT dimerization domain-containing protein [Helianthus annuus]|nr:putative HAT dimerization domain-containing protein [Helianthus annuus]